jgi:hypothetical protein
MHACLVGLGITCRFENLQANLRFPTFFLTFFLDFPPLLGELQVLCKLLPNSSASYAEAKCLVHVRHFFVKSHIAYMQCIFAIYREVLHFRAFFVRAWWRGRWRPSCLTYFRKTRLRNDLRKITGESEFPFLRVARTSH